MEDFHTGRTSKGNIESTTDGLENSGARSHLDMYKPKRPINDVESPFYLHPSDHPGLSICHVMLKGDNYEEWTIAMKNAFCAKRKMGFLNGRISKPTDPDDEDDWYSIRSDIAQCREQGQGVSVYFGKLKKLWDELVTYVPPKSCSCGNSTYQISSHLAREREEERRDSGAVAQSAAGRSRGRGSGRAIAAQQHVQHPSHTGFQPDAQDRATLGNAIQPDQW
ncbi:hypothetical protein QQ045_018121 [Rhodiola kirilowii]